MYRLVFGGSFLYSAKKLDNKLKRKIKLSLDILQREPFNSTLHTKTLSGELADYYSFRLGRAYRVIFRFISSNVIYLVDVGHRKDIYR